MRRSLVPILILVCLLTLLSACFGSALFRGGQFAYRDAAHFYYPLYQRVQQEWDAGRWPLWAPEENAGMPLLGNPTAAVLYPGKVIYALLPYAWGARLYVVAHTILAFAGMLVLLRGWDIGWTGAAIGALSYAFGAPVLFQYCNIIFLVGAAWAPWGFRAVDRLLRLGRRWALLELSIVLAMQTLGGDPQSAYMTGICAGGYALGLARNARGTSRPRPWTKSIGALMLAIAWVAGTLAVAHWLVRPGSGSKQPGVVSWSLPQQGIVVVEFLAGLTLLSWAWRRAGSNVLIKMLAGLGASAVLAVGLTAAQLLPVLEFTGLSIRVAGEGPHVIYPFSLEPHRLVEMVWPNVFGTTSGENRMWLAMVPPLHNPSIWTSSLYIGGLAFVLALGAAGFRGGPPWRAWLTAIAVLSFVASMGEYGSPLWWARSVPGWEASVGPHDPPQGAPARVDGAPHDGDGSLYWLMATALPGFGSFRYPSKLLTFTALAVSALAGIGWDRLAAGRRRTVVITTGLLLVSLVGLAITLGAQGRIVAAFAAHPVAKGGTIFGPLHPAGAVGDLQRALLHGSVVLALSLGLVIAAARHPKWAGALALVLLTADLALANAGLVMTIPQSDFETPPKLLRLIEEAEKADPSPGPFRVHRMPLWDPTGWYRAGSPGRYREMVRWERDTLQPKYAIPFGLNYTLVEGTTELYDYWWFFGGFLRKLDPRVPLPGAVPGASIVYYPRRGFDLWNTRYFILPVFPNGWKDEQRGYASFLADTELVAPRDEQIFGPGSREQKLEWIEKEDWQLRRNKAAYPRAWIVHDARRLLPISGMNKQDRQGPMQEILFENDALWNDPARLVHDPRKVAWIDTDDLNPLAEFLTKAPSDPSETVTINMARSNPQRVELKAVLKRPGLVILADVLYPGWKLTIDEASVPILRANRLMRGAPVRAGTHTLVYSYDPPSFRIGAFVSLASLVALLGLAVWAYLQPAGPLPPYAELRTRQAP